MFKQDFKYYKSKKVPPDLNNVLDFNFIHQIRDQVRIVSCVLPDKPFYGLKPVEKWEAYELINNSGLIFIRNPFTPCGQKYWIVRCLRDYTKKPNKLNLDNHEIIPKDQDWWDLCQNPEYKDVYNKLRWATLGYHHDWDTKVYSEDCRSCFPLDLASLSKYFSSAVGYDDFQPEAAIINYYHKDSTLSGHSDRSEEYLEAPLFSFSFGQTAIFLIGGSTLDVKPTALFLHSGDVIVMSKQARLFYHGVPRIISTGELSWNDTNNESVNVTYDKGIVNMEDINKETSWMPYETYVKHCRININVRQVLKDRGE